MWCSLHRHQPWGRVPGQLDQLVPGWACVRVRLPWQDLHLRYPGEDLAADRIRLKPRLVIDGHWIAFRSAEGMAYAVDPVTLRGRDLFGNRRILAGVHWSPDSRYVVLSERFGFASNFLHFRNPFLMGVMLIVRVEDGDSVPIGWIGPESRDDRGFDWVSDYRTFLQRAALKPIVPGCE